MNDQKHQKHVEDMLWVLVKLKESVYAIDSSHVEAIFQLDEPVTMTVKNDNEAYIGVIKFRGSILPLVDLRCLIGMESFTKEEKAFDDMLEQRKGDHIRWVNELKRCVEADEEFKLATDPHKCAFGKWYDSYEPISQVVSFHLNKIDEPHKKLHASALETFACPRHCDSCTREECMQVSLKNGAEQYMHQVVALLEEAKQVFKESYRRMVVVISNKELTYGLIIDEVLSVENLVNIVPNTNLGASSSTSAVTHIATKKNDDDLIMVLNLKKIFALNLEGELPDSEPEKIAQ